MTKPFAVASSVSQHPSDPGPAQPTFATSMYRCPLIPGDLIAGWTVDVFARCKRAKGAMRTGGKVVVEPGWQLADGRSGIGLITDADISALHGADAMPTAPRLPSPAKTASSFGLWQKLCPG